MLTGAWVILLGMVRMLMNVSARVKELPNLVCVRGNHDAATLGEVDQQTFNHEASLAITWTKRNLKAEGMEYLLSLPEKLVVNDVTIVHGSPHNPVWDYVMDYMTASRMFQFYDTRICLVGHTHVPAIWKESEVTPPKSPVMDFHKTKILNQNYFKSRLGRAATRPRPAGIVMRYLILMKAPGS